MSILGAMYSAVSGLSAQGAKLGAISDNIANAATTSYKRSEIDFSTLVTGQATRNSYAAGGVQPTVRTLIDRQGLLQTTQSTTDLAINGNGFFVVADSPTVDTLQEPLALTRAGSFSADENGFLRNAQGYYLMGFQLNPDGTTVNGIPARDSYQSLEPINVTGLNFSGSPTKTVSFAGNLPAQQANGTPGSPVRTNIQYFSELGDSFTLSLEWTPSPDSIANHWGLTIYDSQTGGGTTPLYTGIVEFNGSGAFAGIPSVIPGQVGGVIPLTVNGGVQPLALDIGVPNVVGGITQFAGDYVPTRISKDGASFGVVSRVEVSEDGIMTAVYNNGLKRPIYQVPVAMVANPNGLSAVSGTAYQLSRDSGTLYLWDANVGPAGKTIGNALERSNVDIAQELTALIETQRTYSSNAKVVMTADEMLEEVQRIKR